MYTCFIFDIIKKEITVLVLGTYLHNFVESEGLMKLKSISFLCFLLTLTLTLTAAFPMGVSESVYTKFSRRALDVFDTLITLIGYTRTQEEFDQVFEDTLALLRRFDQVFDAYNGYEGLNNLYYVNRHAAESPVVIPEELFDLISWCKEQWNAGLRSTNIAMGSVLSIWHEYREAGMADPASAQLPAMEALRAASEHTNFDRVILDAEKQTVFFADPEITLDIGAVAKGWAADAVLPYLQEHMPSFLISLGGNVYAGEAPLDGRANWAIAVEDPRPDENSGGQMYRDIVDVHDLTVVTSGDYERYYMVDGQRYHHIIDPETLFPSTKMISVTILCESSTLADFLSTTLFVLSLEDGLNLIESMDGVEALWMLPDGTEQASSGLGQYLRSLKNAGGAV